MPFRLRDGIRALLPPKLLHSYRVVRHLWLFPFERELAIIPRYLSRDGVAVDVGANVGLMVTLLARYSKRVIAFEPNPACAEHLRRLKFRNCDVVEAAVSDNEGTAALRVPHDSALGSIEPANTLARHSPASTLVVRTVTLDQAVSDRLASDESVSFIKIDVEGHEYAVLKGARHILETHRPVLMIEAEYRHNPNIKGTFSFLDTLGFRAFIFADDGSLKTVTAEELGRLQADARDRYVNNVLFLHSSRIEKHG